jgi:hypothetical protein
MQTALPARREALRGVPDGLQPGQERATQETGMNPADRTDPSVIAALARRCELCGALPGKDCRNTVDGRKLPGRVVHHYRVKETGK